MKEIVKWVVIFGIVGYVVFLVYEGNRNNETARAAGFVDASDQTAAIKAKIPDAKEWAKERALREKKAAEAREEENLAINACVRAESAVKATLAAPSTASFPNCWDYQTRISTDRQTVYVTGHVDAQNRFGAMIRSRFTVTLKRAPGARLGLEIVSASLH